MTSMAKSQNNELFWSTRASVRFIQCFVCSVSVRLASTAVAPVRLCSATVQHHDVLEVIPYRTRKENQRIKLLHTHTHTYTFMHACTHAYIHTNMNTYKHTYIQTYMNACLHAYMHACIHTNIHTYIHTYIHTHGCLGGRMVSVAD